MMSTARMLELTHARAVLSEAAYNYYAGGAEDETTLRANRAAFGRFYLRPRVLVDVGEVDTSVELLGERLSMPILLAHRLTARLASPFVAALLAQPVQAAVSIENAKLYHSVHGLYDFLVAEHVLLVQGTGFNWPTPDHLRIVTLPEARVLTEAIEAFSGAVALKPAYVEASHCIGMRQA